MGRPLGPGSIRKSTRGNGTIRWTLYYRVEGGKARKLVLCNPDGSWCRTKTEALRAQAAVIAARDGHGPKASKDAPWRHALEAYIESKRQHVSAVHLRNTNRSIKLICETLGIVNVADITRERVLAWRDEREKEVGPNTCNHDVVALGTFTKHLSMRGILPTNPLAGMQGLPVKQRRPMRAFTDKELKKVLAAAEVIDERIESMNLGRFRFGWCLEALARTGMRYGELRQITWGDVEFGHKPAITIRASIEKTKRGRIVPVTKAHRESLKRLKVLHSRILGRMVSPQDLVWRGRRGKALRPKTHALMRFLNMAIEEAGLEKVNMDGESLTLHSFRHTACTRLLRSGTPPQVVAQYLGHNTMDMVLRTYNHLKTDDIRVAIEQSPEIPLPNRSARG